MINKPKYKIARRLGTGIFEKTQTQKFALRQGARKESKGRPGAKSDFGLQMLEKQKARYSYGINERQFAKYVNEALAKKGTQAALLLYERLETRLDNTAYRLRLAPTRQASRQMVSHGHIMVNGVRVTVPSYNVKVGDEITVRPASSKKAIFADLGARLKDSLPPSWLHFDAEKMTGKVQGKPKLVVSELIFDISAIIEFYRR